MCCMEYQPLKSNMLQGKQGFGSGARSENDSGARSGDVTGGYLKGTARNVLLAARSHVDGGTFHLPLMEIPAPPPLPSTDRRHCHHCALMPKNQCITSNCHQLPAQKAALNFINGTGNASIKFIDRQLTLFLL